jgi:hypothetical protein
MLISSELTYYDRKVLNLISEDELIDEGNKMYQISQKSIRILNNMWGLAPIEMTRTFNHLSTLIIQNTRFNAVFINMANLFENRRPEIEKMILAIA